MNRITASPHKAIIYWLLTGCALIYVMVVIGCLTRLTHSGLSITDWSFMGSVPPFNDSMWQERFEKYQKSPEFQKVNYMMRLEEFKPIFLWEYVHRLTGRVMMYVFAFGFIFFLIRKKISRQMWPWFILLFGMGALQALIGWWMVYSGLRDKPAVSHYRLAIHLISAFSLFGCTFWFTLQLIFPRSSSIAPAPRRFTASVLLFFLLLFIQIIYGAFTAGFVEGNDTHIRPGHIYNSWPKMGEHWIPPEVSGARQFIQAFTQTAAGIQFVHRTLAVLLVAALCMIWYRSNKLVLDKRQHFGVTLLIYGITVQFILGVLTLLYNVPVVLGALHQTGAFLLFAASIFLFYQLINPAKDLEPTTPTA